MAKNPQQAVVELHQIVAPLRRVVVASPSLLATTDAFVSAVASFGSAELYARADERREVLGLSRVERSPTATVKRQNDRGLAALANAQEAVSGFREEAGEHHDRKPDRQRIDALEDDLREALAELDLKPSDAAQIDARMRKLLTAVRNRGADGLADQLEEALRDLEKVRKRRDRGMRENIPLWKALTIVLFLGVGLFALFRCAWWGECHPLETVAWIAFEAVMYFITAFC